MKFTLSWLKDHLDTKASVDELATTLSAIGLEVESVEDPAKALGAIHDCAHRRSQASIRTPTSCRSCRSRSTRAQPLIEVVCGAPNARAGMLSSIRAARHLHSRLEDHAREEAGARRRVERHDVLGGRARAFGRQRGHHRAAGRMGVPRRRAYIDVAGLNDPVFEVKLTPNRPDCTGVRGIARDLAAAGLGTLKPEPKSRRGRRGSRVPDRDQARILEGDGECLSRVCRTLRQRREERPVARLAAEPAEGRRSAARSMRSST